MLTTSQRIREVRTKAGLRQEELAVFLGVGIATIQRWESPGGTRPTGLPAQVLEVMSTIDANGVDLTELKEILLRDGGRAALRWLLAMEQRSGG